MRLGYRTGHVCTVVLLLTALGVAGCNTGQQQSPSSSGSGTSSNQTNASPNGVATITAGRPESTEDELPIAGGAAKIMIVTNGFSAFWESMNKGREDAARQYNVKTEWEGPPHSQVAEQNELMEEAANNGYNCMAVSAVEGSAVGKTIDRLTDRGMKVITIDSDAPASKRIIYIGTDNFESGQDAGKEMVSLLPHGGNVWGFVGNQTAQNAAERIDGFKKAVEGHNIRLVGVQDDNEDPMVARKNVESVLHSNANQVQALLGIYSYDLPIIAEEVNRVKLRKSIKLVGFDAEPETLQALQNGGVDATVVQKPYEFGHLAVKFLYLVQRDGVERAKLEWNHMNPEFKLVNDKINTGIRVVTPANIQSFMAQLKKWGVNSS
ncbi:MAG: sugar-binding protein [Armatimonadota bacterium]|nr:sugar-binding protein [Armatimonadota bacterium]